MSGSYDKLSKLPWTPAEIDRLKVAIEAASRRGMTQPQIAEAAGISRATLQRTLAGQNPGWERLEAITRVIGLALDAILPPESSDPQWYEVPVASIQVAAGTGVYPLDETIMDKWPFPRRWLETLGPLAALRVVHVVGDSQEPVLRDGDAVIIDTTPTTGADGMHVVRLDDALMIKRVQIEGARIRLKSHNVEYDDIVVDMPADRDRFAVIGRAVASVKAL